MLVRAALLKVACAVGVLVALCSMAGADIIAGAGDVAAGSYDSGNPLNVIDTSSPVTLSAGQYKGTEFSCELNAGAAGTILPFLATSNGDSSYTIVAVGDAISYDGTAQLFQSHAFGGADVFSGGTVYAGYYWQSSAGGTVWSPIGYAGSNSADVWADSPAAWAPVKDAVTPAAQYSLGRAYDFSITVASIPEPSSIIMLSAGLIGLLCYAWRKQK